MIFLGGAKIPRAGVWVTAAMAFHRANPGDFTNSGHNDFPSGYLKARLSTLKIVSIPSNEAVYRIACPGVNLTADKKRDAGINFSNYLLAIRIVVNSKRRISSPQSATAPHAPD